MPNTHRSSGPITRKYMAKLYSFRDKMKRAGAQGARGSKRA